MDKRLKLEKPLVFQNQFSSYTSTSMAIFIIAIAMVPLFVSAQAGPLVWFGGAISAALLWLGSWAWHKVHQSAIVNTDGIEMKSLIWKNRLLWNDAKELSQLSFRNADTHITYGTQNAKMTLSGILPNYLYLHAICHAAIYDAPGPDGYIPMPAAPVKSTFELAPITATFGVAAISLLLAVLILSSSFEHFEKAYFTPLVPISQAINYLDKKQDILLQNKLHSDLDISTRDGKNKYALQIASIKDNSNTNCGSRCCSDSDCSWSPTLVWLQDGSNEIEVTVYDPDNYTLPQTWSGQLTKDWKNTDLFNLLSERFDADIDKKLADLKEPTSLILQAIPQDARVMVAGHVVKYENHLRLNPSGKTSWIQINSLEAMKEKQLSWLICCASLLLWSFAGIVTGIRQHNKLKQMEKQTQGQAASL
ncbi:MAG: hypothetical protein IPP97_01440 [Candidatus Obscuribacter sp.]|nr:hypothetical protein [Candidatus Obscuribacter sp.]